MCLDIRETILIYEGIVRNEMLCEAGNDISLGKPHFQLYMLGRGKYSLGKVSD